MMGAASDAPLRSAVEDSGPSGLLLVRTLCESLHEDPQAAELFREEIATARKVARIPGLVPIREADAERLVLSRSYSAHGTVADRLGTASTEALLLYGRSALETLRALHSQGVAHGDPGPYNLVLAADERVFLSDPGSCRRRFAQFRESGRLEKDDPEADLGKLLAWIHRALLERPEGESLRTATLEALSSGSPLERAARFLDIASGVTGPERNDHESQTAQRARFLVGPAPGAVLVEAHAALVSAGADGLAPPVAAQSTLQGAIPLSRAVQAVLLGIARKGHPLEVSIQKRDRSKGTTAPVSSPTPRPALPLDDGAAPRPEAPVDAPLAYVPLVGLGITVRRLLSAARAVASGETGDVNGACLRLAVPLLLVVGHVAIGHALILKIFLRVFLR